MRFAKGHGTGNDFVILLDPDGREGLTPGLAARLCDRRTGIGGDGVLRVVRTVSMPEAGGAGVRESSAPEWFMDYRNADGSIAEMCGNGIRVFTRYLLDHGMATGPAFLVGTRSGNREVRAGEGGEITAEMGAVGVLGPARAVVGGRVCDGLRISVGNPHLACLVELPLDGFDLATKPVLDPVEFPEGGNVELVRVVGPGEAEMRVHERGSGETRSCGTGAVAAVAAAAVAAGQREASWRVTVPGGALTVTLAAGASWLSGPAVIVGEGELSEGWLASAAAP